MIKKLKDFYTKHRTTILKINDSVQGLFILSQSFLPEGKLRTTLGVLFIFFYGGSTARYYIPKKG
jgi:hypothetical protein